MEKHTELVELEQIMRDHGHTFTSLAREFGKTRQNVSQLFKGMYAFTVPEIRVMARLFEMDAETVCRLFRLL